MLWWLQQVSGKDMRGVIESRAKDVNFWHLKIIQCENPITPKQRTFTHFKRWQQAKRAAVEHVMAESECQHGLSIEDAENLIGKGLGHTRKVIDVQVFDRIGLIWRMILICSAGVTARFLWLWVLGVTMQANN